MEELQYPIGKFQLPENITDAQFENWKNDIESLPAKVQQLTDGLKQINGRKPTDPMVGQHYRWCII